MTRKLNCETAKKYSTCITCIFCPLDHRVKIPWEFLVGEIRSNVNDQVVVKLVHQGLAAAAAALLVFGSHDTAKNGPCTSGNGICTVRNVYFTPKTVALCNPNAISELQNFVHRHSLVRQYSTLSRRVSKKFPNGNCITQILTLLNIEKVASTPEKCSLHYCKQSLHC